MANTKATVTFSHFIHITKVVFSVVTAVCFYALLW